MNEGNKRCILNQCLLVSFNSQIKIDSFAMFTKHRKRGQQERLQAWDHRTRIGQYTGIGADAQRLQQIWKEAEQRRLYAVCVSDSHVQKEQTTNGIRETTARKHEKSIGVTTKKERERSSKHSH